MANCVFIKLSTLFYVKKFLAIKHISSIILSITFYYSYVVYITQFQVHYAIKTNFIYKFI